MGRIREKLDQHLATQYDLKRLREQYEMSLPAMREQLLARLLDSSVQEEWAREKAREMRLTIAGEQWTIALIRYNGGDGAMQQRVQRADEAEEGRQAAARGRGGL